MQEAERKVVQALADLSQLQGYIAGKLHCSTDKLSDLLRTSLQRQAKLHRPALPEATNDEGTCKPPSSVLATALAVSDKVQEIHEMIETVHATSVAQQCVTQ